MLEPRFSASELEELSLTPPEVVRDWRRRKLLDGIGKQNGRWKYNAVEVTRFAIVKELMRSGVSTDILNALWISENVVPLVFAKWGFAVSGEPKRFAFFWSRPNQSLFAAPIDQSRNWDTANDLQEIEDGLLSTAVLFDSQTFAENRKDIKQAITAKISVS